MTLQVKPIVPPIWVSRASNNSLAIVGSPWDYLAVITGGDGPVASTLASSTIPAWLSLVPVAPGRWLVTGRPSEAGSWNILLRASNGGAASDLPLTINALAAATTPISKPEVTLGSTTGPAPYTAICLATDDGVAAWRAALSGKDSMQARGFAWDATSQAYVEFPAEPAGGLTPFHAVFLATRLALDLNLDGLPRPMPAVLTLKPGWNFLGIPPLHDGTVVQTSHPWNYFTLQTDDTTPLNNSDFINRLGTPGSGDRATARPWLWNGATYEQVDTLVSGTGYWFKNNSASDVRLLRGSEIIPAPAFAGAFIAAQPQVALADRGQPPAPPGNAGAEGSFSDAAQEPDLGGGSCGLGSASAGLFLLLMLFLRLHLRGTTR